MSGRSVTASACLALCAAVSALAIPRVAFAVTYYWDTNGSASGIGSAGGGASDWLANHWATGSSGTLATGPWPNTQPTNDDEAVFRGTAGTVNLAADVYANALTFESHNYSVASTGGALYLVGDAPTITVNLPSNNNTSTITAPILGDAGFTLAGNSLSGGLKFLVLANTSPSSPNAFSGTLDIAAGGALRLGGGAGFEQIPDDVDLNVAGVIDFVTSGGASDGKQERVRNVTVTGPNANFSIGNEADFIVNSIVANSTSGAGIAINGNSASAPHAPGRLVVDGWADGAGNLTLNNGRVRINTTGASSGAGGRVLLAGNLYSSGNSEVTNVNGSSGTPEHHVFDHKGFDFTGASHTIEVTSGTLTFTSATDVQPLDVTSTNPGGSTLTKTGAGVLLYEYAVQSSFTGTNRIEQGTLRLGASERLANGSQLEVAGGTFDMQGFSERVGDVVLDGGAINGTAAATLTATSYDVRSGTASAKLGGSANLTKSTGGTVTLSGANAYTGTTTVSDGTLLVNGSHTGGGAYFVEPGGTLGGTGTISAPVVIDGTLAPGSSVGTLTVNGNVSLGAGSRWSIELAGTTADRLTVAGDLDLSATGNVLEVLGNGTGGSWLIASYTGTLAGVFESIPQGFTVNYGSRSNGQMTLLAVTDLVGDYNDDGRVDAGDYVRWRNNLGGPGTSLENRDEVNGTGAVSVDDYLSWRAHYGDSNLAEGSGGLGRVAGAVPEPARVVLWTIGLALLLTDRRIAASIAQYARRSNRVAA